jgi:hypothetical protein
MDFMKNEERVDRRASSPKRNTDILKTEWPVTSHALYLKALQKTTEIPDKLRTLCMGRIRVGHALTAVDKAIHEYSPQLTGLESDRKIHNRLRSIRAKLEQIHKDYPLQIT